MNRIYMLIISLFMLMPYGCKPTHVENLLSEAESVMEENPEKALSLLDSINDVNLNSRKLKAKHGLLRTQAMVKTDMPIESDTLINESVIFYSNKSESPDYMKSLFYQGQVRFYLGQYDSAIVPATKAREIAIKLKDHYWQAKAAELIADIYAQCYLREEVIKFRAEAAEEYGKANKINNKLFTLTDLACAYYELNEEDSTTAIATTMLDSLLHIAKVTPGNEWLTHNILKSLFIIHASTGNLKQTKRSISALDSLNYSSLIDLNYMTSLARYEILSGNEGMAINHLKEAEKYITKETDKINILSVYDIIYGTRQDYQKQSVVKDSLIILQNKGVHDALKQSAMTMLHKTTDLDKNKAENKVSLLKYIVLFSIIIFIIIITAIIIIYHIRIKLRKKVIEEYVEQVFSLNEDIARLSHMIQESNNENNRLQDEIQKENESLKIMTDEMENLFMKQWSTIGNLCNDYLGKGEYLSMDATIPQSLKKEIEKLMRPQAMENMTSLVDKYRGNIITLLKNEGDFIKTKEDEIIFSLLFAGLSNKTVCFITNLKFKTLFTKKYRLKQRILASDAPHKEMFLSKLE